VGWENNLHIILDVLDVGVGGFTFRIAHKVLGHDLHDYPLMSSILENNNVGHM
jgi:hypothetical protein